MSLAAILSPPLTPHSTISSQLPSSTTTTNSPNPIPFTHQQAYITLHRMLIRYQHILLNHPPSEFPSAIQQQVQSELRSPLPFHRTKWLHNIEHARTLLLQLEHTAQGIKVQSAKRAAVHNLAEKRVVIKKLRRYVEDVGHEVDSLGEQKWEVNQDDGTQRGQTIEEILGRPPLSQMNARETQSRQGQGETLRDGAPVTTLDPPSQDDPQSPTSNRNDLFASSTRRRGPNKPATEKDTATTSGFTSPQSTERMLHENSRTHETLTSSLLNLTVQLKQQSQAFAAQLATSDKDYLARALDGLDRNVSSMTLASKNMAYLKRLSEGEGWWGRMKLYAMIYAMWAAVIFLVFVMPKLRF